ncbi:MAG TPA: SdrD B-like domain-containing protein, partial [Verrucomicrobiota bacterium]|nr:SdrD B-like domain-containing protein [Verrucomicrobiota bacterium]
IADGGNVAWQGVGTTSLGGMDINEEETRLYVMDLQNRRLVMLDAVTGAFLAAATVPTPPGIAPADVRPFGVKIHRGTGYITITGSAESTPTVDTFTDVDNDGLYRGPETFWDENQNGVFDGNNTPPGEELFDRNGNNLLDAGEPFVDNDGNGIYNEGNASQLKGFVYTFDLGTLAFGSSPIFEIDFRYERIYGRDHLGATGHWRPWRDTFRAIPREQFDTTFEWSRYPIYPQPWLKAIEFDNNGDLILAIADRYGHQIGSDAPDNPDLPFKLYNAATVGDLLKAGWNGTSWVLESGARVTNLSGVNGVGPTGNRMGPGGGEFYFNDHYAKWHPETAMGAIIQVPGYPEVLTAIFDPNWLFRNGDSDTAFDGGFAWFDNTTGERRRNYRLYDGNAGYPTFGKASGLGGLVIQTRAAYLELGNRVWNDVNKNGIQDPGEPPIASVVIGLFRPGFGPDGIPGNADDNTPISTVMTDANGNYLFSNDDRKTDTASADYGMNLLYNTDYVIGIRDSNFSGVLTGFVPTTANAAGISNDAVLDVNDSDAVLVNAGTGASFSSYGVALNTGNQGYNNHSYDFGFVGPLVGLGNLVFKDRNANGRFDAGDTRVPGVRVELWTAGPDNIPGNGDDVFMAATTTDGDGRYLFQTTPGTYYVKVPAS